MTTPSPIPPAMLTVATEAIQRQQYTSPLVSRNLADAALAAAGYGELVAALEEMVTAMRVYQMDVVEDPPFKHRMMMHKTRKLLARVHGEAGEGER